MPTTPKKANALSRSKNLSRSDIDVLQNVFQGYPDIQAVYLFGSFGSGTAHLGSDLDLAIVTNSETLKKKKIPLLTDLAQCGFCNVDLVFLNTEDVVLKYEAVRQNRIIYSTPDFDRGRMYSKVVRQYLDFEPYLKTQRKAYKRRIECDSTGSHSKTIEQAG